MRPSTEIVMSELDEIKRHIRTIPDWPKAGVMFRDITPLLQDPRLLRAMTRIFVERYAEAGISLVAGIDARGFIIGPLIELPILALIAQRIRKTQTHE